MVCEAAWAGVGSRWRPLRRGGGSCGASVACSGAAGSARRPVPPIGASLGVSLGASAGDSVTGARPAPALKRTVSPLATSARFTVSPPAVRAIGMRTVSPPPTSARFIVRSVPRETTSSVSRRNDCSVPRETSLPAVPRGMATVVTPSRPTGVGDVEFAGQLRWSRPRRRSIPCRPVSAASSVSSATTAGSRSRTSAPFGMFRCGRGLPVDVRRLGERFASEVGEPRGDVGQVLPPLRLRDAGEYVVPQREEGAPKLEPAGGTREEPDVQMRRPVAPPIHVNPRHAVERADRPLQPNGEHPEFRREEVRQVAHVEVRPRLQDQHHRQTRRTVERAHPPPLADPDVRRVRRPAGAALGRGPRRGGAAPRRPDRRGS